MANNIDATEMIKSGWKFLSDNINKLWPVALLLALPSILSAISTSKSDVEYNTEDYANVSEFSEVVFGLSIGTLGVAILAFIVVTVIYSALVYGGSIKLMLESLRGKVSDFKIGEIFKRGNNYIGKLILLGVVSGFIVGIGLLLLIVPGIIAIFFLSLSFHYMVDKDLGVGDSISSSYNTIKDNVGSVLPVYLGLLLVGIVVSAVANILFGADVWVMRVLSAVAEGFVSLFGLIVVSKLYLVLSGKTKQEDQENS